MSKPTVEETRQARIEAIKALVARWVEIEEMRMGGFDDELPNQIREIQYLLRVVENLMGEKSQQLETMLKEVPQHAVYFALSWSPDRHNWRAEIDDMARTWLADHHEPIAALKAVFVEYQAYEKQRK